VRALQLLDAGHLKAVVLLFAAMKPISRSVPRTSIALLMNYTRMWRKPAPVVHVSFTP
jgi:hypothetical protein